jgi:hypothetical protein
LLSVQEKPLSISLPSSSAQYLPHPPQFKYAKYAGETPQQIAQHRAIAWHYDQPRQKANARVANFRKAEIEMLFKDRYHARDLYWQLPDDDAGRDDLRIMLKHLAPLGEDRARQWAEHRAPWMPEDELDALLAEVGPGRRWTSTTLGRALNLKNETRLRLGIRTIRPVDRTAAQLAQDAKERQARRERERRLKDGATPRAASIEQTKPWEALGFSRRTYFRRRKNGTVALIRAPYLESR